MSVIGIDFGNESSYVATAKAGGIETLANDYSLRATPSCVAFAGRKRILGVGAKNQQVTNMLNTVFGFKRLLGRPFNDPHVRKEIEYIPIKVEERADGKLAVLVNYLDKEQSFTPEQLTAMLFTKLKETSAHALQTQVNDCVIACPVYFTNAERKALLEAAEIAGLNVLRLMNETTATALSYGFYKPDLSDEKPRTVVFVDCGQASLQVSACTFTKGRLKMLASTWDQIGGRDFDRIMAEHFGAEFKARYNIDVKTNPRAMVRLLTECEKLKRQMSANSTKLPLNVECFMNDVDVSSSMQRSQMEELCAPLLARVEQTFRQLLVQSGLELSQIHAVEIVGGTSRIPAIKQLIEHVFGQPASTTLNQDESVSRGAALQCAIMSPAVRVRGFGVVDVQNYPVKVSWDTDGFLQAGEIVVFPQFHAAPFSRLLTLNRKEPFTLTVQYATPVPYPDQVIGRWHINVKPSDNFEYQEVKIKVRINQHGIVLISNASVQDRKEVEEQQGVAQKIEQSGTENMEVEQDNTSGPENIYENEDVAINTSSSASSPGGHGWAQRVMGWFSSADKKKKASKVIDLQVDCVTHGSSPEELTELVQQESNMVQNDAKEILRVDAKNTLEEFIYESRNKLLGQLERYVTEKEREEISSELNFLENWLYDDGEDCEREVYTEKYNSLKQRVDPIAQREIQFQKIPIHMSELEKAIKSVRDVLEEYKKGSPKYAHLTDLEVLQLNEAADKAKLWMDRNFENFKQTAPTMDLNFKYSEIDQEVKSLTNIVQKLINRPKSKVPTKNNSTSETQNGNPEEAENSSKSENREETIDG